MDDLSIHLKALQRVTFIYLAICLMGWALIPSVRSIAAGLVLGGVVSLVNSYFLAYKIRSVTKKVLEEGQKRVNLGLLTRVAMAVLAVMVAVKSGSVNVYATVAGLLFAQFIILFIGFTQTRKNK
ncbi:ATP synthase subunit I [Paenibacillus guangzhouensis]|uniref:ATP synthase subunit I n=1 Tax=Paenibacillus guangzhouensis TaxID=1473112 RepID=UPI0012677CC6|nr:ATP synthase subunit I [Paenibacillus guangzhouensis]